MSLKIKSEIFAAITLTILTATAKAQIPKDGVLANEQAALKVAESILVNLYGEKVLAERPFLAKLEGDYWIIKGSFHCPTGSVCKGGVAHLEISKKDGRVKSVIHDK